MELKGIYTNMIMSALLIFGILSFTFIIQEENDSSQKLSDNPLINDTYNDLFGNLSANQGQAQTSSNVFGNFTPNENLGVWEVTPIVSPTRLLRTLSVGFYNIFVQLPMKVLGVSPLVAGTINGILLFLLIIGIWAVWKGVIRT